MSTHTPGPWSLSVTNSADIYVITADEVVARVLGRDTGTESAKTNAALIAAAPEMAEALRGLLAVYAPTARNKPAKEKALAALAKAGL